MTQVGSFRAIDSLRREIDKAFEDFGFSSEPFSRVAFLPGRSARRYPLINLYEDKENICVEAIAPGVNPDSVNLAIVRNAVTISGEKGTIPKEVKSENFHRNERAAGEFVRTIEIPVEVDEDHVEAQYRDGLLLITLPKAEKAKPKPISVKLA